LRRASELLHCRHFGKTTFANVSGIRIVDLPGESQVVPADLLQQTSNDRVAVSSPAGCRSSLGAD
jgi:hypothetical protein